MKVTIADVAGISTDKLNSVVVPEKELEVVESKDRKVFNVPLPKIKALDNSRQTYDSSEMAELMVSMRQSGLLQPIGVSKEPGKKYYRLVFGNRRFQAAQKLGWKVIDAVLVPLSERNREEDSLIKNSVENIQRANVSLPEQGRIFAGLVKSGLTAEQIAARVGCKKKFVASAIEAFYRIPQKFRDKITVGTRGLEKKEGEIPASSAFSILRVAKSNDLNQDQTEKLFQLAEGQRVGARHINIVGQLLQQNYSLPEAMKLAKKTRVVAVEFTVDDEHATKIEKKYGVSLHDIAYTWLEQNHELQVYPMSKKHVNKTVVVTRKAKHVQEDLFK